MKGPASQFGQQLKQLRKKAGLTQRELAERLEQVAGQHFSPQAISLWEREASQPDHDNRRLFVGLIQIFHHAGVIATREEADQFLQKSFYGALSDHECQLINPDWTPFDNQSDSHAPPEALPSGIALLWQMILLVIERRAEGDGSEGEGGGRFFLSRRLFTPWPAKRWLVLLLWVLIGLVVWQLVLPVMYWPVDDGAVYWAYIAGIFLVPFLVGGLVWWSQKSAWEQAARQSGLVRFGLHTLGALVGLQVGFFMLWLVLFFLYQLQLFDLGLARRVWQFVAVIPLLWLARQGSLNVPHNTRLVYGRLRLGLFEGGVALLFLALAPMFAGFLARYQVWLLRPDAGIFLVLTAMTLAVVLQMWRQKRGSPALPVYVWVLLFGLTVVGLLVQAGDRPLAAVLVLLLTIVVRVVERMFRNIRA